MLVFLLIKKRKIIPAGIAQKQVAIFALLIPVSFLFFVWSLLNTKLSVGTSGFYLGTLLSSLILGMIVYKEKLTRLGGIGLVCMLAGFLALIGSSYQDIVGLGFVYGIISGVAYGFGNYYKKSIKKLSREHFLLIISLSTAVFMLLISLISGERPSVDLQPVTIAALLGFMVITSTAEYLTVVGFQNFPLYLGSIVLSLEIVFSAVLGLFIYGEVLSVRELIGVVLILVAVILSNLKDVVGKKK